MDAMINERENLPSASGIPRIMLCRGSWNAERNLPEITSADAQAGTEHHRAFETGDDSGLDDKAKERQQQAREIEQRLVADWLVDIGREDFTEFRERRLWIVAQCMKVCSAKLDYLAVSGPFAIVLDLKTGHASVPRAEENWQLITQAIAVLNNHPGVSNVRVGIVQPGVKTDTWDWTTKTLEPKRTELLFALAEANNPNAQRTPGEAQCKYCRARATCPEANAVVRTIAEHPIPPALIWDWTAVPVEDKLRWFNSCKLAKVVIKEIEKRIKADLEADSESIPGLVLKESQGDRKVTDVNAIYNELEYTRQVLTANEPEVLHWSAATLLQAVQSACSLPVGKLTELVREMTGWKAKEADTWINEHCSDWVKRGEPSKSVEANP